jgi:D-serine deaminase-like pyridoxal phosphate-dependent protein
MGQQAIECKGGRTEHDLAFFDIFLKAAGRSNPNQAQRTGLFQGTTAAPIQAPEGVQFMHNNIHIVGANACAADREPLGTHPPGMGHKFSA